MISSEVIIYFGITELLLICLFQVRFPQVSTTVWIQLVATQAGERQSFNAERGPINNTPLFKLCRGSFQNMPDPIN